VCLLQQLQDLSDQQALDALSFDLRFQHALDVTTEEAYLSRRSLVEFRRRLVEQDPDGTLLRGVFDRICAAGLLDLGLDSSQQRLDSTLVESNIRAHGRLSVARETLRVFVRSLDDAQRARLPEAVRAWDASMQRDPWQTEGKPSEKQARLHELGHLVATTLEVFAQDEHLVLREPYRLLRRLADEHSEALGLPPADASSSDEHDDSDNDPPAQASADAHTERLEPKQAKTSTTKTRQARYWSPHDPDASYGHKGLGYHVHVAETCRNERAELLTDYAVLTAAQSDIGQGVPALQRLAERGLTPRVMYADGGYPTPSDLVTARQMGTELYAPVNRGRLAVESFSRADFRTDPQSGEVVQCPAGHAPIRHSERESSDSMHHRRALHAFFEVDTCEPCPQRAHCPVRQPNNARSHQYRLELSPELMARDARWAEQKTQEWKSRYRIRSGVEATMSELKRGHGLGRLRVRRLARVQIQVALKTTACNIKRWMQACAALLRVLLWALHGRFRPYYVVFANLAPALRAA
jgi:IS5 family transposase